LRLLRSFSLASRVRSFSSLLEDNMAIPDFQSMMLPLLEIAANGEVHTIQEARDHLAARFNVSEEELKQKLPSGKD